MSAPRSYCRAYSSLREDDLGSCCPVAIVWGKATENPVKKVRFAREDNGRIRMLNPEEGLLLAQCASHLKPILITALHTGFRASESLSWADVDFSRRGEEG